MESSKNSCSVLTLINIFCFISLATASQYNVLSYEAKPDGTTDSTKAFLEAWNQACSSRSPANIYVPAGKFLLRNVRFQGPCRNNAVVIRIDGTLVAPSNYQVIGTIGNWVMFEQVDAV